MAQKITAVEWLFDQYVKHNGNISEVLLRMAFTKEKEQIMDAYEQAYVDLNMSFRGADRAEQYYEDVYGE
jgi:hypothetical protein